MEPSRGTAGVASPPRVARHAAQPVLDPCSTGAAVRAAVRRCGGAAVADGGMRDARRTYGPADSPAPLAS